MRVIACLVLALSLSQAAPLQWPPVTKETKPWSRWWWLGSTGSLKDMSAEMEKYSKAGIGGLEITPIYGVKGQEKEFRQYLSPQWMEMLSHSLKEGTRLGMGIDMATGNGWPFGGLWVDPEDACRTVAYKTYSVKAGERLSEPVRFIQQPLVRAVSGRRDIKEIKEPIRENQNLQAMALDQVRFEKSIPLVTLMAYSGDQKVDLTSKVAADGKLDWVAPAGNWTLYAVFQGWHGKQVERAGPGGEGDVIDHMSSTSLDKYLKHFDNAFAKYDLRSMRAYFNDSYEVDDASGEHNWTPLFLQQFQKRRGYDLREQLPALFAKDTAEKNSRVLSDFRETVSDLLLDEFTKPWHQWAQKKGATTRNQSHGSPANILDLYAASGIPETEGDDILNFKFASSAAHVTGKRLASAEAATWLGEHFSSSLGDAKKAVDLFFLGGINHICYHGTPFSPESEQWPGIMFYASVHFGPTNSFWNDFSILNQYVTRAQSFLQGGEPDNDILLYYPVYDAWAAPAGQRMMPHFTGPQGTGARAAGEALVKAGYAFDFASDRQVNALQSSGGDLLSGKVRYGAVLVPEVKVMPVETLRKLVALAEGGATVIFNGMPGDVSGFGNLEAKRKEFKALLAKLNDMSARKNAKQRVFSGTDLTAVLKQAGVRNEELVTRGISFERRRFADGTAFFLLNRGTTAIDGWVPLSVAARAAGIFDPMTGAAGLAAIRKPAGAGSEVYVQLAPGQSLIVKTANAAIQSPLFTYWKGTGPAQPVAGTWDVQFVSGGPKLPAAVKTASLGSWTDFQSEGAKSFSGTGKYSISFAKPTGSANAWRLDLGKVAESARVFLNGKEIAGIIEAPYAVTIPAAQLQPQNTLEVHVSNLMANRVIELDRQGVNYKRFYNINFPARRGENRGPDGLFSAAKWTPRPSGLLGPVTLTPLASLKPQ